MAGSYCRPFHSSTGNLQILLGQTKILCVNLPVTVSVYNFCDRTLRLCGGISGMQAETTQRFSE